MQVFVLSATLMMAPNALMLHLENVKENSYKYTQAIPPWKNAFNVWTMLIAQIHQERINAIQMENAFQTVEEHKIV